MPINRYIQSHTILKSIAHRLHDEHVLVLGGRGNTLKSVANRCVGLDFSPQGGRLTRVSYGFQKVYNPLDILAWNHALASFYKNHKATLTIA